jgi:peptidoglycan/xylan/chitin deacetylase (PgdA/CDA1 family)
MKFATLTITTIIIFGLGFWGLLFFRSNLLLSKVTNTNENQIVQPPSAPDVASVLPIEKIPPSKNYINKDPEKYQLDIPVLAYHHIDNVPEDQKDNPIARGLRVSPGAFENQMKLLKEKNYTTLHIDDYTLIVNGDKPVPENSILLTFDDGYTDNYEIAFKVLKKYDLIGNFAIVTDVLSTREYMSPENVKEIYNAGMGIMSHTTLHCSLAQKKVENSEIIYLPNLESEGVEQCPDFTFGGALTKGQVEYELVRSKNDLEKLLGTKIDTIVYPYSNYNKTTLEIAKKVGYKFGFTTKFSLPENKDSFILFQLPRIIIGGQENPELQGFFTGI